MISKEAENDFSYADRAFIAFTEIMANNQKDMLEHMNRANKGELFVLHFLAMRNAAVTPSELSAALRASTARVSALLGKLEKKGLIERDIDRSNRRNILVTLTDAGREHVHIEMDGMRKSVTRIFIEMGEQDTEEFIRLAKEFFEISQKYMPPLIHGKGCF